MGASLRDGWQRLVAVRPVGRRVGGASFGCQVVVDVAVRHPETVGSLVLAGPTVDPRGRSLWRLAGQWLRNSVGESPRMAPLNIADYRDAGLRGIPAPLRLPASQVGLSAD